VGILVSIDNGGTLTDVCALKRDGDQQGELFFGKTLTTPHDLSQCFMDALKVLSERIYGEADLQRLASEIEYIRYSTTQGTNALVQRKGPRLGVIAGSQADIDALNSGEDEADLFAAVVGDRTSIIDMSGDDESVRRRVAETVNDLTARGANRVIVSFSGDNAKAEEDRFRKLIYREFPRHLLGAVPLIFGTEMSTTDDRVKRTWAAMLNSFLHPAMEHFLYNAEDQLRALRTRNPLLIFRNDGGSTRVARTVALNTYSSGPRGGVEGALTLLGHYGIKHAVSMDIGGTTTDIAVFSDNGVREQEFGLVEGIPVPFRLADMHSVGAGGSTMMSAADGKVKVGPESAGAAPGPACFGRGGTSPTFTDVLLLSGFIDPASYFGGQLALDAERARKAVMDKVAEPLGLSLEDALTAISDAYHDKIAEAMRPEVEAHPDMVLLAFGGAGPISGCGVADRLGLKRVLVPRLSAVFSAFGIGFSDIADSFVEVLNGTDAAAIQTAADELLKQARRGMKAEGFDLDNCELSAALVTGEGEDRQSTPIDIQNINGAQPATGTRLILTVTRPIAHFSLKQGEPDGTQPATADGARAGIFGEMPLYKVDNFKPGDTGDGPAIVEDELFTCAVPEGWSFSVTANGDIDLRKA
jgi:N-methylhydantoinase A/oxoprolinase/acetone carboxylase beta subunit